MARERKWEAFIATNLLVDGGTDGEITIASTCGLHTKQLLIFKSTTTQSVLLLEVKKVVSETVLLVGPKGGRIDCYSDMSSFLVAESATIEAKSQERPNIKPHEIVRSLFEEEPIVGARTVLVDQLGNIIKYSDGKLPVEATITSEGKNTPTIKNITVAAKETEESFTFPSNVIAYELKLRKAGLIQLAFISGQTDTEYLTIKQGNSYIEEGLDRTSDLTIYFETTKDNVIAEIKYWTK